MIQREDRLSATLTELTLIMEEHYLLGLGEAEIAIGAWLDSPSSPPMFDEEEVCMKSGVLKELFIEKASELNSVLEKPFQAPDLQMLEESWKMNIAGKDLEPLLKRIQALWMKALEMENGESKADLKADSTDFSDFTDKNYLAVCVLDEPALAVLSQIWYYEGILDGLLKDGRGDNPFPDPENEHRMSQTDSARHNIDGDLMPVRLRHLTELFQYIHLFEGVRSGDRTRIQDNSHITNDSYILQNSPSVRFQDVVDRYDFLWFGTRVDVIQVEGLDTDWGFFGIEGGQ